MTAVFLAAQALALAWLCWVKYPYPRFLIALAGWFGQAFVVAMGPPGADPRYDAWLHYVWMPTEAVMIGATAAACWESAGVVRMSIRDRFLRVQLFTASMAIPAAVVGIGVCFVAPIAGDTLAAFRIVRGWAWALMALSLGVTAGLLALQQVKVSALAYRHLLLMLAVLGAHAIICWFVNAPDATRALLRDAYRATVVLCCMAWVIGSRVAPESAAPAHPATAE